MFEARGVPTREIDGLPYSVHQVAQDKWQIVIQNCERHPAGYTFPEVYHNLNDALQALTDWPESSSNTAPVAGDDTGAVEIAMSDE